jgi:hypothetical protein
MLSVTHSSPADGTFSDAGRAAWDAGHTVSGYQEIIFADSPNQDFDLTNGGAGGAVTIISKSITGIAAKDQIILEVSATLLNNSAAGRTYTRAFSLGGLAVSIVDGAAINASATDRAMRYFSGSFSVSATNLAYATAMPALAYQAVAANTAGSLLATLERWGWNTTATDLTGTQTLTFTISSGAVNTTQTLTLHRYIIRKISMVA